MRKALLFRSFGHYTINYWSDTGKKIDKKQIVFTVHWDFFRKGGYRGLPIKNIVTVHGLKGCR
ncbi:MAG: hypothetical protein B1H11_07255 [Desulfobacteraceae bacterium 4484_190.1]|nr:MAG: hypothetical protein B1H11_07255 [Desulfobacteraceae bacterium 4484_190.1]